MQTDHKEEKTIKSTRTAFDIIEVIAARDRPSITEIADAVDCSRSTVHYHLRTLQRDDYVIRGEGGLRLGLRMARLGNVALRKHRLTGVVEQTTDDLAAETDAVAHVAVEEGNNLVWLYRSAPETRDDCPTEVGEAVDLHCTAYGQAILAHVPVEVLETVVADSGLREVTEQTLTSRAALEERLSTIRQLGFAYSPEEYRTGLSSIAAPIFDGRDEVVGSIGITDTQSRIDDPYKHPKARRFSDELPGHVQKAARIVSDHVVEL
jgi:DNA-binding IclR family transcriptional regulator